MEDYKFILDYFKQKLVEANMLCEIEKHDDITILKVELNNLGVAEHVAMMEIVVSPYEIDDTQLSIQFYTTIAMNIPKENYLPALDALNALNLTLPLGSLHIFSEYNQLYHHYTLTLKESYDDELKLSLGLAALLNCIEIINIVYDEALIISDDVSKLEQYYKLIEDDKQEID